MIKQIIGDTSAIVAAIKSNEAKHLWSSNTFRELPKPILTCEAVVAEAYFILSSSHNGETDLLTLIAAGVIGIDFSLSSEIEKVLSLMKKYDDMPMSLADACLVRMCELEKDSAIFTLDSDFRIYRKNGRYDIPLIMPDTI